MPDEKPRLGPWLRHYGERRQESRRDRVTALLLGLGAAVAFGVVLVGVLWAFVRRPLITFAALFAVWAVGLLFLYVKRLRQRSRRPPLP